MPNLPLLFPEPCALMFPADNNLINKKRILKGASNSFCAVLKTKKHPCSNCAQTVNKNHPSDFIGRVFF